VELAAKPVLLLFLDEPISGLDSQSSWAIIAFLRKTCRPWTSRSLSTIHELSSILFQKFDRLLFLVKGGRTVYFGDIGHNSQTSLDYFEKNGARLGGEAENPTEYMLEIVGAGASRKQSKTGTISGRISKNLWEFRRSWTTFTRKNFMEKSAEAKASKPSKSSQCLPSRNCDMLLLSLFISQRQLRVYSPLGSR
jgi:ABC-type multidrug transport system ATPase subunit